MLPRRVTTPDAHLRREAHALPDRRFSCTPLALLVAGVPRCLLEQVLYTQPPVPQPPCMTHVATGPTPVVITLSAQVVVAEAAPRFDGHVMARKLADAGIATTLIADSAVYAMMARANKVRRWDRLPPAQQPAPAAAVTEIPVACTVWARS